MQFFSRFNINTDFLNDGPSTWDTQIRYLHGKEILCSLNIVNDTKERAVKLMEDFHGRSPSSYNNVYKNTEDYILIVKRKH